MFNVIKIIWEKAHQEINNNDYQELLKRADDALYKAKYEGRNKVVTRFEN